LSVVSRPRQLDLFGAAPPVDPPHFARWRALAERVPEEVRFGTSSWTFPGWAGLVYPDGTSEKDLLERGLELYARCPLFRTVGIDRSYYRPLDRETLRKYAAELPSGFRAVLKVWADITSAVDSKSREPNARFLDVELFDREVLRPLAAEFSDHLGPLVFELSPLRGSELVSAHGLPERLNAFFAKLPREFSYAVELRTPELLTRPYLDVLARHGVAHVLNFWERMPDIGSQLDVPGVLEAPFAVTRLLIPPGQRYASRRQVLEPFNRLTDPQQKMRADVVRLVGECAKLGKPVFVISNNKAEGSSPLTIAALAERLTLSP